MLLNFNLYLLPPQRFDSTYVPLLAYLFQESPPTRPFFTVVHFLKRSKVETHRKPLQRFG